MANQEVFILSSKGLQSRLASKLVKKAMSFKSSVAVTYDGKTADAKSLINTIALKIPRGAAIKISVSGDDEVIALHELIRLVAALE